MWLVVVVVVVVVSKPMNECSVAIGSIIDRLLHKESFLSRVLEPVVVLFLVFSI
jgi:hypothetical protein